MLELELDVDEESLALTPLLLEHAVEAVQDDAAQLDRHATLARSIAAAAASASTCGATSWARKREAPRSNAATAAPTDAAVLPTFEDRVSEHPRERALPRQPDENGPPDPADPLEPADERQVLVRRLPEPDPGIEADMLLGNPRRHRDRQPFLEERGYLTDDVRVPRLELHRARLPLHVHQANVRSRVRDHTCEGRIGAQRGDVVHERHAHLERAAGDLGLRRVDRDRKSREPLEHRENPSQLLVDGHRLGPGAGGLAADVDEQRTFLEQPPRRCHRRRGVEILPAVGEAVGCDVDDAHHRGTRPTLRERGTSHKTMERTGVRGARRRPLLGLGALVLLLVAVAVASTGSVPAGAAGTRRPAEGLVDVLISLYLLLMVVGVGLWVYILLVRKDAVAMAISTRRPPQPVGDGRHAGGRLRPVRDLHPLALGQRRHASAPLAVRLAFGQPGAKGGHRQAAAEFAPQFATGPVLVVLALVAVAIVAWYLSHRARRRRLEPLPDALVPALADVLEETLDDLRAETDPRRAVIAAYARMERALAAFGLPRSPSEAPDEYLQRIFSDLEVSRFATSRLTALFTWAKFSGHDVAPEMKQEAIEALEAVREELEAAEILAEQQRLAAVAERRERAGA